MEIIVTTSEVKISEENNLNQGEVNVHKVHFSFSKDYDGYTKYARFFVLDKKIDIAVDNEGFCDIPHEATQYKTEIRIGAYGEKVENEKLKRWSPTPTDKIVLEGTYNGEGTNTEELTPTDKQQMNERIQTNADNIESLNANKQNKLTEGDNITIDEDGVISATDTIYDDTEVRESIQSLNDEKVDKITGKGLSTNDFTNEDKSNLDSNTTNRHNHSNKSVLDSTTASYTTEEKTKLGGVASNAQVNVIESISVNGNQKTVTNKNVDIDVPTELSQLSGDSTHRTVSDTEKSTWNSKVDKEVNNLTNYYTKDESDAKLSSVYKYCGTVNNYSDLPSTNLRVGDVYNIVNADSTHHIKAGDNVAWNGSAWDVQSGDVDLSNYYTKQQANDELAKKQNNINADNKVNSDFINDEGSTHKFVTAEEKAAWNGKADGSDYNTFKTSTNNSIANINGFLLNGTNPTKIKDFLTMMRAMLITEGEYGVEWDLFATNNSSSCTKLYDNVGLSITPGTDSTAEVNNYPKIFESIDCNYININGEDIITALKGMSNYGETPSEIQDVTIDGVTYTPDVGTVHFSRYEKYGINSSGKMEYSMSWIPRDGYTLIDLGKDKNGNFKPYFIIAKYVAGYDSNNKVRSAAGLDPACHLTGSSAGDENADHNINYTNCITIFHTRGDYYSAALMSEYGFIMRDFWLKFATRNTQSIMAGNTSNNYQYAVATAETGVHRVVLTNAQAANIDLLSCVSVGDRDTATNNDRINKYLHNICKCARVIAKETVDTDHTALILDHANFNTTSTTYVSTMHERSGYSKFVRGRYGSPINNTNGKHGMVFNGIEIAVGGYEVAGNAILDIIDNTGKREVYVTNNATKLSGTVATIKDTYTKSSLSIQPTTLNALNYITRYDYDLTNGLMIPTEAGQSGSGTSTGFADRLYVDNATSGQRECLWLGSLTSTGAAGLSCLNTYNGLSDGYWLILARLSTNGVRG